MFSVIIKRGLSWTLTRRKASTMHHSKKPISSRDAKPRESSTRWTV